MHENTIFLPGQAHPRVSGENGGVNVRVIETDGSSPRERGKQIQGRR